MQLTQAVGRDEAGGVSHFATLTWDSSGCAQVHLHRNALYTAPQGTPARPPHFSKAASPPPNAPSAAADAGQKGKPAMPAVAPLHVPRPELSSYPPWIDALLVEMPTRAQLEPRLGPRPLQPRSHTARYTMTDRPILMTHANPHLEKQACMFDFRQPDHQWDRHPYFFTWQRFNILARWRCALRPPLSRDGRLRGQPDSKSSLHVFGGLCACNLHGVGCDYVRTPQSWNRCFGQVACYHKVCADCLWVVGVQWQPQ